MTIHVVLVDDQELIRVGFRMVLESRPGIVVVGEADDGDSAVELLASVAADVVCREQSLTPGVVRSGAVLVKRRSRRRCAHG